MTRIVIIFVLLIGFLGIFTDNINAEDMGKMLIFNAETGKTEEVDPVKKTDIEWKNELTPEQYSVTRAKGTEKPFSGKCGPGEGNGLYKCVGCDTDLFRSDEKFESGTGWPSFWEPVSEINIRMSADTSFGMDRIEVSCARCGAHLGHVFDDGPDPTGKRYCINSVSLNFIPVSKKTDARKTAVFAAGCFWGIEKAFSEVRGVLSTAVGYTGGTKETPTYEEVCSGHTGHAEAVKIQYDPAVVDYDKLLDVFWSLHDPTTLNRQGPDVGTQYRSAIFYLNEEQKNAAIASKEKLQKTKKYAKTIVTEITPFKEFYPAEDYHQKYYEKSQGRF